MRCKRGTTVLLTVIDGTAIRGVVVWSWRWRVVRLVEAYSMSPQGPSLIAGSVLVPHRSILVAQVNS